MRFEKSLKMVPIIIGLTTSFNTYAKTEMAYNENDIRKKLVNMDLQNFKSSNERDKFVFDEQYNRIRFKGLLKNWYNETAFSSNIDSILENNNLKQILSLGNSAIPFIIEEINNKPSYLVWSLNILLNKKISNSNITINDACRKWVIWWNTTNNSNV